jgi:uncharacterized protein (TIGR03437 family)
VVSLPVVPSKPAIFTHEAGGNGLAKAINQDGSTNGDGSLNSSDRPAPQGSVIQVFASGLGPVDPPIPQGTPAPVSPLSVATMPISANIGGRAAVVTYAGAAPGQVGVYQVNIAVPALTPSGANSLVLIAGGNPSQSGVFIQVR